MLDKKYLCEELRTIERERERVREDENSEGGCRLTSTKRTSRVIGLSTNSNYLTLDRRTPWNLRC